MKPYIYLRCLRHVDHTVFNVTEGQKTYFDPVFGFKVAYSSGQQVKRSILEGVGDLLNQQRSPLNFVWKAPQLEEGEVFSVCDPSYYDQILGGWMQTSQKKEKQSTKKKGKESEEKTRTLKRRSPLSISAMRPLHPLLSNVDIENMTFDRSDKPEIPNKVIVRDSSGKALDNEQIEELLSGTDRSLLRKWLKPSGRATGLFVFDVAIDLRTLFCVSTNQHEPELSVQKIEELKSKGWLESENVFGKCLVLNKVEREKIIPALAHALLNWRITSNQARTFSLMETLAVAISDNANTLAGAIRAKLIDEGERLKAKPILDETAGADVFVTLPCSGYLVTVNESADALDKAERKLIDLMNSFNYEQQIHD